LSFLLDVDLVSPDAFSDEVIDFLSDLRSTTIDFLRIS
jgi:hypothetical protein